MTARKTTFTEPEFRAALAAEIRDLILGRTTYTCTLEWLYQVRIGLGVLPQLRIAQVSGGIKLLLSSLRADAAQQPSPCEAKPSHTSHSSHSSRPNPKGGSHADAEA
jgi:hypothetical protein